MPGVGGKANNLEQEKESKSHSDPLNAKMILMAEFERAWGHAMAFDLVLTEGTRMLLYQGHL